MSKKAELFELESEYEIRSQAAFEAYLATLAEAPTVEEIDTVQTAWQAGTETFIAGDDPDLARTEDFGLAAATPSGQAFIAGYAWALGDGTKPDPDPEPIPDPESGGRGGKRKVHESEDEDA